MKLLAKFLPMRLTLAGLALLVCIPAVNLTFGGVDRKPSVLMPKDGFVPNEKTAVAVAKAVLTPILSENFFETDREIKAELFEDTWRVSVRIKDAAPSRYEVGGTFEVEVSKSKGCILHMYSTQ